MNARRLSAALALTTTLGAAAVAGVGTAAAAATGTTTATTARASAVAADPAPECNGANARNCWEYYSWYWTYANCHAEGRNQLNNNPGRYDDYNCAGEHGAVVWLWLHHKG